MLDSQGSRADFRCGQGVKHENLLGQDLDRGRGWEYRRLCSVPPLTQASLHYLTSVISIVNQQWVLIEAISEESDQRFPYILDTAVDLYWMCVGVL